MILDILKELEAGKYSEFSIDDISGKFLDIIKNDTEFRIFSMRDCPENLLGLKKIILKILEKNMGSVIEDKTNYQPLKAPDTSKDILNKNCIVFTVKPVFKNNLLKEINLIKVNNTFLSRVIQKEKCKSNESYIFRLIEKALKTANTDLSFDKSLFEDKPMYGSGWYIQKINDYFKKYIPDIDIKTQYCIEKPGSKRGDITGINIKIIKV